LSCLIKQKSHTVAVNSVSFPSPRFGQPRWRIIITDLAWPTNMTRKEERTRQLEDFHN
jgi:hypothetical protein